MTKVSGISMVIKLVLFMSLLVFFLVGCSNNENTKVESEELVEEVATDEMVKQEETKEKNELKKLSDTQFNIENFIQSQGFSVEVLDELEGLKKYEDVSKLRNSDISYEYLCSSSSRFCTLISYAQGLIVLSDSSSIHEVMYIKNKDGQILNPSELGFLRTEAERIAGIKNEDHEKSMEKIYQKLNEARTIRIGMTQEEVKNRWGQPEDINRTITAAGTDEQWVYPDAYVYFEDGILTTIQQ